MQPIPELQPQPTVQADPCNCGKKKPGGKDKKKKKRKERTVCFSGEYVEEASGLRKTKKYVVDCKTGEEIAKYHRATAPKPRKGKPLPWNVPNLSVGV